MLVPSTEVSGTSYCAGSFFWRKSEDLVFVVIVNYVSGKYFAFVCDCSDLFVTPIVMVVNNGGGLDLLPG